VVTAATAKSCAKKVAATGGQAHLFACEGNQTKMQDTAKRSGKEWPTSMFDFFGVSVPSLQMATEVSLTYMISSGETRAFPPSLLSLRTCLELSCRSGQTP
jgi:hypothetical protein